MVISDNNHRRYITFPKELEKKLDELAKEDNRTFNNYIIHILKKHVEETEKKLSK